MVNSDDLDGEDGDEGRRWDGGGEYLDDECLRRSPLALNLPLPLPPRVGLKRGLRFQFLSPFEPRNPPPRLDPRPCPRWLTDVEPNEDDEEEDDEPVQRRGGE
jgi:hypothetical protein